MEELEVEGLVIRETQTGEADEILTILTADHGKITISG
ncbi:MAG: recombination protein O N-terminal domain-containing protein, partial [Clostridia bacterium]|nr:recombination protein O N-terminal domain-containing protein [Clostridia bacterium]